MSNKYLKIIGIVVLMLITMGSLWKKNKEPNTPLTPTGPTTGYVDSTYTFSTSATDPDANNLAIRFLWGNDTSVWSGYVSSGNTVTATHTWTLPAAYSVRAQSKDEDGLYSSWSSALVVNIISRFAKTYGGTNYDMGRSVQKTIDDGYIIAGYTLSYGAGNSDVYLVKTNANGDTSWTKTFGGTNIDAGYEVQQTSDGGYIIAGRTLSFGADFYDFYLIKTDASGTEQWHKTFGGSNDDYGYSVQQTTDGGYIITGTTNSYGTAGDLYLVKTNANGDTVWTRHHGGSNYDTGRSVRQTSDGGYIIAGYTLSYGAGNSDVYLIKTDASGTETWHKTFGGASADYSYAVRQTTDGGYIITGYTDSYGADSDDVYLIKTNASGTETWYKTFGGSGVDDGYSVTQTTEGGYIITGYTASYGLGGDVYLIKTDASGNVQ